LRSRVLFVTKADDDRFQEGFIYATGLAKISEGGVFVLLLYERNRLREFEDEMAAAALAGEGEFGAAREILNEGNKDLRDETEHKVRQLQTAHGGEHLIVEHRSSTDEVVPAIRAVLQEYPAIEIVIISPSLMDGEKSLSFKKLRRKISRPVVTMSRPARA